MSDEIIRRSEQATRQAIRELPPGTYHGESSFDVPGGDVITLKAAVTINSDDGSSAHRLRRQFAARAPRASMW